MTDVYPDEDVDEPTTTSGYRSYEVYQRERVGETTNLVNPRDLMSDAYLADPFTVPGVLQENYPCFRDWVGNRFWLTRYDDVTSVFVDDANFESRPRHGAYGSEVSGRALCAEPLFEKAWVDFHDAAFDQSLATVLDGLAKVVDGTVDLAADFADRLTAVLLGAVVGLGARASEALELLHLVKAGTGWDERDRVDGIQAHHELRRIFADQLAAHKDGKGDERGDLLRVCASLDATPDDVVVTLLDMDLDTLPASLANLWCLLLTNPDQFGAVKGEPRLMKFAYLEALRHSPPIVTADRFARHEVERFGRLLPQGALVHLSAAAANRDPRQFADPASFDVARTDLCRREPRGQYRADGLPAAITFGHGKPSLLPAIPRDTSRSRYALTRDIAVKASLALLDRSPGISLLPDMPIDMTLDRLGGVYRCRTLPVTLG